LFLPFIPLILFILVLSERWTSQPTLLALLVDKNKVLLPPFMLHIEPISLLKMWYTDHHYSSGPASSGSDSSQRREILFSRPCSTQNCAGTALYQQRMVPL